MAGGSWVGGRIVAALSTDRALATQNVVLFNVHLVGVYRYLVRKAAP